MHPASALFLILLSLPQAGQPPQATSPWRADLRTLVQTIDSVHPWPWRRTAPDSFHQMAARLDRRIDRLPHERRIASMMQLVASLHDGHTTLHPANQPSFTRWFPVRFQRFADSIAITAIDSAHAELAGARLVKVNGRDASAAADLVATLHGADNAYGKRELTAYMSSAGAMKALGLSDGQTLQLELRLLDGTPRTLSLAAVNTTWGDPAWMQRGEMFGPPQIPVVTAFDHLKPLQYRERRSTVPLSLRNRIPVWFTWLAEDSTLYVQSNFVQDFGSISFSATLDSAFALADTAPVRRLILDLRYNSGGDGSKVKAFVHSLIRRPALDTPGRLVLLTGPKTFSAAVLWLTELREHTNVVTIGEPAGAARNHSGDATEIILPRTGMVLQVSVLRHYGTRSDDPHDAELPDFPIAARAGDYFAGRDLALSFARSIRDLRSIPSIAAEAGMAAAVAEGERRQAQFGTFAGWELFDEREMNSAAYTVLGHGRAAEAVELFAWNARAYPCSGNTWDSLGEALLAAGDSAQAIASYQRASERDPGNEAARTVLRRWGARPIPTLEKGGRAARCPAH